MSNPVLPIPASRPPEPSSPGGSGEGAQTALAAMIRKRRMAESHVDEQPAEAAPRQLPGD